MAYLCSATDVIYRLSERGVQLRVDDRPEAISWALREATNRVKMYLMPLYTLTELQTDADGGGMVNDLTSALAACALSRRRGNTIPAELKELCKQTGDDLQALKDDRLQLPDVPQRHISSPAFSNVRVDPGYVYKKVRVEVPISEATVVQGYTQNFDWRSFMWVEY